MTNIIVPQFQLIFIFASVIIGVLAASYFYLSTDIFNDILKRPLRYISSGMIIMTVDILLAAFISYEWSQDIHFTLYGVPLEAFFFLIYIIGSLLISIGARGLAHRPVVQ